MKPRLLIIASHPIQYHAPWFRGLHADGRVALQVLFLSLPDAHQQGVGFGHAFEWDVPLLDGYEWRLAPSARGGIRDGWWGLRLLDAQADLTALRPDAVLVTGWQHLGLLQGLRAARRLRLPILLRAESNGLAPLGGLQRARNRWIVGHADRLLPIGQANRLYYEALGCADRIGPAAPYFVDNDFFNERGAAQRARRGELRRRFGIPEEGTCFLFAGKLVEKKRPGDLLDALGLAARLTSGNVHALVVGTGPLEAGLEERAAAAGLPSSFAGFLNQTGMPAAYAAADCLVLPSDYGETWGLVVNEAMACGLPAIVSDRVGCGPDLVRDSETGFRFRFGAVGELADRMVAVTAMGQGARQAMGARARDLVRQDYSIGRAVEGTVQAVLEVVNRPPGN